MNCTNDDFFSVEILLEFREFVKFGVFSPKNIRKRFLPYARHLNTVLIEYPNLLPIGAKRRSYKCLIISILLEKAFRVLLYILWGFPFYIVYHTYRWEDGIHSEKHLITYTFPVLVIALIVTMIYIVYFIFFRYKTAYIEMLDVIILCSKPKK